MLARGRPARRRRLPFARGPHRQALPRRALREQARGSRHAPELRPAPPTFELLTRGAVAPRRRRDRRQSAGALGASSGRRAHRRRRPARSISTAIGVPALPRASSDPGRADAWCASSTSFSVVADGHRRRLHLQDQARGREAAAEWSAKLQARDRPGEGGDRRCSRPSGACSPSRRACRSSIDRHAEHSELQPLRRPAQIGELERPAAEAGRHARSPTTRSATIADIAAERDQDGGQERMSAIRTRLDMAAPSGPPASARVDADAQQRRRPHARAHPADGRRLRPRSIARDRGPAGRSSASHGPAADAGGSTPTRALATGRPDIVDRNGEMLATDIKTASLFAEPRNIIDRRRGDRDDRHACFPTSTRQSAAQKAHQRRRLRLAQARDHAAPAAGDIMQLGIPGIGFRTENRRFYPGRPDRRRTSSASSTSTTRASPGSRNTSTTTLPDRPARCRLRRTARTLEPVKLSLDLRVQHIVRDELAKRDGSLPRDCRRPASSST